MEMAIEQNESDFRQEINRMQEEHNNTYLTLENEKRKISEMVELIKASGDYNLMSQIANIIQNQYYRWNCDQNDLFIFTY